MLKIRLMRFGKKKQPTYRLVVSEQHRDMKGSFIESLGFYNPRQNPSQKELKADRIKYWLSNGAQASPTVHNLLVDEKVIDGPKVKATRGKKQAEAETTTEEKTTKTETPSITNTPDENKDQIAEKITEEIPAETTAEISAENLENAEPVVESNLTQEAPVETAEKNETPVTDQKDQSAPAETSENN
ncbi:MAG: 30S ribosomal protein S16 [Patescibacteria group bacterium]|jgi:small subunit ribosomal protein S16|nr:30S ribosomal protein S16 [Patescibacteria group bacterium]